MPADILKSKKPSASWNDKERKYELRQGAKFDSAFLPVVQNLAASGLTEADIGMIFGYAGDCPRAFLLNLKASNPDVKLAWETGKRLCNSMHVAQMIREAWGYDYEEVEEQYKYVQDKQDATKTKKIKIGEKRSTKHKPGNAALLQFIAENRLPNDFKRRFEVTKKNMNLDLKGEVSEDQIDRLFGKLCERKAIEAEVLEASFAE